MSVEQHEWKPWFSETEKAERIAFVKHVASFVGCRKARGEHRQFCDRYNDFIKRNTVKIASHPRSALMSYDYAWCQCFASVMGIDAGMAMKQIPVEMSCTRTIRMWMTMGNHADGLNPFWVENDAYEPAPGDYIYIDHAGKRTTDSSGVAETDHVGIVEWVADGVIHTIEGNVSIGGYNQVGRKSRVINAADISGFGIPDFLDHAAEARDPAQTVKPAAPAVTPAPVTPTEEKTEGLKKVNVTLYQLNKGVKGNAVKTLQILLNAKHAAGLDIDGSFGNLTRAAVLAYQESENITADGIVGAITWQHLLTM